MNERRIVVPDGMLEAAVPCYLPDRQLVHSILKAALLWLTENPIVPTRDQEWGLHSAWSMSDKPQSEAGGDISSQIKFSVIEWQRRMFLAPEPEVLEAIAAFRRGKASR